MAGAAEATDVRVPLLADGDQRQPQPPPAPALPPAPVLPLAPATDVRIPLLADRDQPQPQPPPAPALPPAPVLPPAPATDVRIPLLADGDQPQPQPPPAPALPPAPVLPLAPATDVRIPLLADGDQPQPQPPVAPALPPAPVLPPAPAPAPWFSSFLLVWEMVVSLVCVLWKLLCALFAGVWWVLCKGFGGVCWGLSKVAGRRNRYVNKAEIWIKRQLALFFVMASVSSILFNLDQKLIPEGYSDSVFVAMACIWGLAAVGLPFSLYGNYGIARELSRHCASLSLMGFSVLFVGLIYLKSFPKDDKHKDPRNNPQLFVFYTIIAASVFVAHMWSLVTGLIWGDDDDRDVAGTPPADATVTLLRRLLEIAESEAAVVVAPLA